MGDAAFAFSTSLTETRAALLDHVSDCALLLDRDGQVIYANSAAEAQGVATILAATGRSVEAALRSGRPVEAVAEGWWRRAAPAPDGGLTLLAHRERALSVDSAARFDVLFEQAPADLAVLQIRADGVVAIEKANAAFAHTTGLIPTEIAGRAVSDVLDSVTAQMLAADARTCIAQHGLECERTLQFPAGERLVRAHYRTMPGRDGIADRVLLTQVDLTETRRIEVALRQALRLEVIGQLTGGVAHDFNNLLTAVLGSLEMLGRHIDDERHRRWIRVAVEAAQRGATLTQQLLAYARKQFLEPTATDIVKALDGMTALIRGSLSSKIALEFAFDSSTWLAHTDIGQLEMSLMNLIVNARVAMPEGGRLTLSTRNHPACMAGLPSELEPGDYVVVSVADTGIGMTPDVLARAMEPFFTTRGIGEGSGLGLSQTYGFARQLGGTVRLTSIPGTGTVAEIFLPRATSVG